VNLKHYRQQRGLSLRVLERATEIDHVRLFNIEHGFRASERELAKIARVLGVSVEELTAPAVEQAS
jgi:transcriptional regulator with XRE-family HTH domain